MDYKVTVTGFHIVEENDEVIPEEFSTYMVITKDDDVMIGHWETGTVALGYDPRGAFFDGIGAHYALSYVKAWKCINGLAFEKTE